MSVDDDTRALVQALRDEDGLAARHAAALLAQEHRWQVLAQESAAGSALAVELLLEELDSSGTVRRFVRRSLLDADAVDDVTQDSLISIASSIGSFRGASKVTTWVHQVVQRRVVDHLRRQRTTVPLPDDDLALSARISSMIATRATVQDAVARLPQLYREPVELRDLHGLEYTAIADRLGRSVGTVKAQISRGRAMVAATIGAPV
jgi:RNA polymerase sigma factor (sigma-70 family)